MDGNTTVVDLEAGADVGRDDSTAGEDSKLDGLEAGDGDTMVDGDDFLDVVDGDTIILDLGADGGDGDAMVDGITAGTTGGDAMVDFGSDNGDGDETEGRSLEDLVPPLIPNKGVRLVTETLEELMDGARDEALSIEK